MEFGDHGLVVMRFDEVNDAGDYLAPIAVWVNWGEHPESLDPYDLHSVVLGPSRRSGFSKRKGNIKDGSASPIFRLCRAI